MPMLTPPWSGATLALPWAVGGGAIVAYCVLIEPLVGWRLHRSLRAAVARDGRGRVRHYRRLLVLEIGLGAGALICGALLPGLGPRRLGLLTQLAPFRFGLLIGFAGATLAGLGLSLVVIWRVHAPLPVVGGERVRLMVPSTAAERGWFIGLALIAGIAEELLFRGLLLAVLSALLIHAPTWLSGAPAWLVVLLGAAAFGLAHTYQGGVGVLATALMGVVLGAIYLVTGSIFGVMLIHAAFDARMALLPRGAVAGAAGT